MWREPHTSSAAGAVNELLARRGHCQLALRLPTSCTNVSDQDQARVMELVGVRSLVAGPLQAQQRQHQQQPTPISSCAAPLPPSRPCNQSTVVQQLEQLQQQQRRQHGLQASLHFREQQWHRDQLATTAAWASTGGAVPCGWVPVLEQGLQLAAGCQWHCNIPHPQHAAQMHGLPAAAAALHGLHIASGIPAC